MRKILTFVIAGAACSLATAQSDLDIERAYAAELQADAANRSSLLQGAGAGSGFTITSGDGASTLNINALFQFRYVANFRDDSALFVGADNDFAHGFEAPRVRLDFSGNLINDNITYRISGDMGDGRGDTGTGQNNFGLTWGYGQYAFEGMDGAFVRWGQFKAPLFWEELVDPEFQLSADRSVTNEAFSQGYSQGIMFGYEAEAWRGYAAITDGLRSIGTNFNGTRESDIALTARAEFKIAGDWERFTDFTSWRNSDYAAKIGAAIHWETYGDTAPSSLSNTHPFGVGAMGDHLLYTIDAAIEGNGWNVFGAFNGSYTEPDGGGMDFSDFGAVVQGGVFVTEQIELFGRWDAIFLDSDRVVAGDDTFNFLAFGANYYVIPESHAVKATLDILFAIDDTSNLVGFGTLPGATGDFSTTSFLGQGDDSEIAVRAQVSVLF